MTKMDTDQSRKHFFISSLTKEKNKFLKKRLLIFMLPRDEPLRD